MISYSKTQSNMIKISITITRVSLFPKNDLSIFEQIIESQKFSIQLGELEHFIQKFNKEPKTLQIFHIKSFSLQQTFKQRILIDKIRRILDCKIVAKIIEMISTIFYPPKKYAQSTSQQLIEVDNFNLIQIISFKILVIVAAIFLPLLLKGDNACFLITLAIALEFWINKNLARTFIKAFWYVDTTTQKDRWVYEAQISPNNSFQGIFWYSSVIYFILLCICFIYYLSRSQISLSCSLLIGLVCGYLNFFAYSKIIKARNSGFLEKLQGQVGESRSINQNRRQTIQLLLINNPSQLKQIEQEQQNVQYV